VGSGWGGAHTYECYSLDDYAAGKETTQIEYKYALGSWDYVEKDGACGEIGNRQLTLSYGSNGVQTVNDTILNWRNVSPCGN
jgi:hypothetical protein